MNVRPKALDIKKGILEPNKNKDVFKIKPPPSL